MLSVESYKQLSIDYGAAPNSSAVKLEHEDEVLPAFQMDASPAFKDWDLKFKDFCAAPFSLPLSERNRVCDYCDYKAYIRKFPPARVFEIIRRYHKCHRPTKKGSVNIDFPEYIAERLYGKWLYGLIKRTISSVYHFKLASDCDPASAFLAPDSFAAKTFPQWLAKGSPLDFETFLIMEYERINRVSSLALRRCSERENMRSLYQHDLF